MPEHISSEPLPPSTVDDTVLVQGLKHGEEWAFEALVRVFGARMLATARRLVGNEEDARDVGQSADLSAFRAIGEFKGSAQLSTWLHRIVVNTALMRLRSRRRKPEESIEALLPAFQAEGHFVDRFSSAAMPADQLLERRETRRIVRGAIERLPEPYRAVLVLRDIEELSTKEVAELLDITTSAVKVRLHRARQALLTLLRKEIFQ
jgi:RNA polymerase sigma-70 factor (ECF subfamily)